MTPSHDMVWTKAKPTKEGWYWWRSTRPGDEGIQEVVQVAANITDGLSVMSREPSGRKRFSIENFSNMGEWSSEPIPMPEEGE